MLFIALLLSYFCGSIPFGVLIGKARGVDVRSVGSGNIGATNVWRTLGPAAGSVAFALDVAKGLAGPFFGQMFVPGNEWGIALCAILAVMGHVFSPFLKFKGGKGIATSLGALLGLIPVVALLGFAVWGVVLGITRMISAASIAACIAFPILALMPWFHVPFPSFVVGLLMSIVAFLKHIPNIKRIAAGVEPKVGQKKKKRRRKFGEKKRQRKFGETRKLNQNEFEHERGERRGFGSGKLGHVARVPAGAQRAQRSAVVAR